METNLHAKLQNLIVAYDVLVKGINTQAMESLDRAYGGIIRAGKGKLVESIAQNLVKIAWQDVMSQDERRLRIDKKKIPVTIKDGYIDRIQDENVRKYVSDHKDEMIYYFGTDVQVYVDGILRLPIECKAYTENAMMKRILFDAALMKEVKNTSVYYLLQLESQLGGDFSELNDITYGSPATHALLSHVNADLKIITLLKGERKVDKPIHKTSFYKPLEEKELLKAVNIFAEELKPYA